MPSCFLLSPRYQGELESAWLKALCPCGEAVPVSHPGARLKIMFAVVGSVLVSAARVRPQPFQGPGPTVGGWPQDAWGLPTRLQWWGSPYPKKNLGSRLLEARAFCGPTGDGLSPQSDLFSGLVQLAAIAPAICVELATVGAGPSA